VIYRLLGELEISRDGQPLELPSGHNLIVLATLLVNANRRMPKESLLKVAWGSANIQEAQLHKSATALRQLLDQVGRRGNLITHARFGYELRIPDSDLDMLEFGRLARQADEARLARSTEDETSHLRQALDLWRGPHPLANVPGEAFRQETRRLEQRRKRVAVRLFDLELVAGHHERVHDDLALIASQYPADGRLCEQFMIAAYRCGHLTDASAAYERHDHVLGQETGGSPETSLRDLYYAMGSGNGPVVDAAELALAQRSGVVSAVTVASARGPDAAPAVPQQLPPRPPDFTGRADLLAEASWLLGPEPGGEAPVVPVILISGPGGVGKTALALEVAHASSEHYPDGQLYMDLHGISAEPISTTEILAQFLRAFQVPAVPETQAERAALYRSLLAGRRVLIVLDDAVDSAQIQELIPAHRGCGVVITSRQKMPDIQAAHHHVPTLAPLDQDTATELFLRRVSSFGIELGADLDAVGKVVALCGGLPLALRIAAALRVHQHPQPTAELASRLTQQGLPGFEFGEQSLARTIGAGYDRLGGGAQQLFLGLGLLRLRSFGLWTAAAVLPGPELVAADALAQLNHSSMIEPVERDVRYRFHELTSDYAHRLAQEHYPDQSDRDARASQVYRALLTLARKAHAALYGGDFEVVHSDVPDWHAPAAVITEVRQSPLEWFEKERLNIRAAISHCAELGLSSICWDLAVSAHEFYTLGGYFDDWYATTTTALRACQHASDTRGEGILLTCLYQPALVASRRADHVSGIAELERAAELLAACGDLHGQAIALRTLASALRRHGLLTRPLALFKTALAGYSASDDRVGQSQTLRLIGQTHLDLGEHGRALSMLESAEQTAAELGNARLLAQSRYWIGQTCLGAGDPDGAQQAFTQVLAAYREPTSLGHAYAAHGLGDLAGRTGQSAEAEWYFALAAELARQGSDAVLEGRVYLSASALHAGSGQLEEQIPALQHAVDCFAGCGAAYLEVQALSSLGRAHAILGDSAAARAAWLRADEVYAQIDLPEEDRAIRTPPGLANGRELAQG
jgi:DNA-binding SARP family transcriptional activator/tetratricopeptide (TPR) repeat protein